MDAIALTGLSPRPDVLHRMQRYQQERQRLWDSVDTRAAAEDNGMQPCPDCTANEYDAPYDYCRVCGYQSTDRHNNHPITAQRSKALPPTTPANDAATAEGNGGRTVAGTATNTAGANRFPRAARCLRHGSSPVPHGAPNREGR